MESLFPLFRAIFGSQLRKWLATSIEDSLELSIKQGDDGPASNFHVAHNILRVICSRQNWSLSLHVERLRDNGWRTSLLFFLTILVFSHQACCGALKLHVRGRGRQRSSDKNKKETQSLAYKVLVGFQLRKKRGIREWKYKNTKRRGEHTAI